MANTKHTIKLNVSALSGTNAENLAASAITPGMLVEKVPASTAPGTVRAHSTAEGTCNPIRVAVENELEGQDIDTAYASGDVVFNFKPVSGDIVNMILADGETATVGIDLVSNGDGSLRVLTGQSAAGIAEYPALLVGTAYEALDLSDSSGGESSGALGYDKRIAVEIR